eukprot:2271481-Pleurochrysis_carterae.AAC.3
MRLQVTASTSCPCERRQCSTVNDGMIVHTTLIPSVRVTTPFVQPYTACFAATARVCRGSLPSSHCSAAPPQHKGPVLEAEAERHITAIRLISKQHCCELREPSRCGQLVGEAGTETATMI